MQDNEAFVAAWKGCSSGTAVRHLDVEAPELFQVCSLTFMQPYSKGMQLAACLCQALHRMPVTGGRVPLHASLPSKCFMGRRHLASVLRSHPINPQPF